MPAADITTLPIETLIAHRSSALLIDTAQSADNTQATTTVTISKNSPFYSPKLGGVPAWVGIEYMAQTVSLWSGYQQHLAGKPIKMGFLLGSKNYLCKTAVFSDNTELIIRVEPCYADSDGISSFRCIISTKDDTLAADAQPDRVLVEAIVTAIEPENPESLLE